LIRLWRETSKQIDNRVEQHQKELPATTDRAEIVGVFRASADMIG
jgi:hypothetical protein